MGTFNKKNVLVHAFELLRNTNDMKLFSNLLGTRNVEEKKKTLYSAEPLKLPIWFINSNFLSKPSIFSTTKQ